MTKAEQVRLGDVAKRAMDDPAITRAFNDVETALVDRWKACPLRDKEAQYEFKLMLKLLGDVRANLEQAYADGKLAAEDLKIELQRQSPIQKLRSLVR